MKSHRPERVANIIRNVVGEAITSKLSDPRIEPLTSVTRVEVSGDLEHAKVYISVLGEEGVGRRTLDGLKSGRGYIQQLVARALSIRQCPRVSFHLDQSLKQAAKTIDLIERVIAESDARADRSVEDDTPEDPSVGEGA